MTSLPPLGPQDSEHCPWPDGPHRPDCVPVTPASEPADEQRQPPIGERMWCKRCNTYHHCTVDHGPDGHGGSSVCCPVQATELATGYIFQRVTPESPLTDEELAAMESRHASIPHMTDGISMPMCRCNYRWPCPTRRLIADLRAARAEVERLRHDAASDYARAEEAEQANMALRAELVRLKADQKGPHRV